MLKGEQGAYFSGGTPENSVDTTAYAPGLLGQEVKVNVGTVPNPVYRVYKYVKAGGAVTLNALCKWNGATKVGSEVVENDTVNSAAWNVAGFASAAASTNQFFWLVVSGTAVFATSQTFATEQILVASSTRVQSTATSFSSNAAYANPLAWNISSVSASSASGTCLIVRGNAFI